MTTFLLKTVDDCAPIADVGTLLERIDPALDCVVTDAGEIVHQPTNTEDSNAIAEIV